MDRLCRGSFQAAAVVPIPRTGNEAAEALHISSDDLNGKDSGSRVSREHDGASLREMELAAAEHGTYYFRTEGRKVRLQMREGFTVLPQFFFPGVLYDPVQLFDKSGFVLRQGLQKLKRIGRAEGGKFHRDLQAFQ